MTGAATGWRGGAARPNAPGAVAGGRAGLGVFAQEPCAVDEARAAGGAGVRMGGSVGFLAGWCGPDAVPVGRTA
ncbi:hypothetical protein GCM10010389_23790 [Streptomyces echinoruber]|uniref:Uncharacterized protein n=1 Tax=Streptomyces echinoruber TaxID=68898 RepID=A0A918R2Z1_9ACTN|nr:hypothetical protein GCM10010389_23790 [Streptomyces echinoruber]